VYILWLLFIKGFFYCFPQCIMENSWLTSQFPYISWLTIVIILLSSTCYQCFTLVISLGWCNSHDSKIRFIHEWLIHFVDEVYSIKGLSYIVFSYSVTCKALICSKMVKSCIHQVELSYWCIISVDGEAAHTHTKHIHAHKLIGEFINVQGYLKQANIAGVAERCILLWDLLSWQ
jgi:hypothetical protein